MKNQNQIVLYCPRRCFHAYGLRRAEANWRDAAGNAAGVGHRRNGYGRNLVYL